MNGTIFLFCTNNLHVISSLLAHPHTVASTYGIDMSLLTCFRILITFFKSNFEQLHQTAGSWYLRYYVTFVCLTSPIVMFDAKTSRKIAWSSQLAQEKVEHRICLFLDFLPSFSAENASCRPWQFWFQFSMAVGGSCDIFACSWRALRVQVW